MFTDICNISEREKWKVILCVSLVVWELIRKGIALYKSGQNSDKLRFIFIFILNTCGILPIIYLVLSSNKRDNVL